MPRHQRRKSPFKQFLSEYKIEITAAIAALVGLFLLVEPFDIRSTLLTWLAELSRQAVLALQAAAGYATSLTPSDLTGVSLVSLGVVFIVWRARYRILRSETLNSRDCPRCGNYTRRIHRRPGDRMIGAITRFSLLRYQCTNEQCQWSGLRLRSDSPHSNLSGPESDPYPGRTLHRDLSPTRPRKVAGELGAEVAGKQGDSSEAARGASQR